MAMKKRKAGKKKAAKKAAEEIREEAPRPAGARVIRPPQ